MGPKERGAFHLITPQLVFFLSNASWFSYGSVWMMMNELTDGWLDFCGFVDLEDDR